MPVPLTKILQYRCFHGSSDLNQIFNNAAAFEPGYQRLGCISQSHNTDALLISGASTFNQDISGWDVSSVTSIRAVWLMKLLCRMPIKN